MKDYMLENERNKGYLALTVFTVLGYISAGLTGLMGIISMGNSVLAGFYMLMAACMGAIGFYAFARIGFAAFIIRDSLEKSSEKVSVKN